MGDPILRAEESNDVSYEFTSTTFRKTSRLPLHMKRADGSVFIWARSWNHERIANEVKALQLVARETSIPVPKLLDHGTHDDGRQYLVTELIDGVLLDSFDTRACSKPKGEKHSDHVPCQTCSDTAYANGWEFIQTIVLPQLSRLTSKERGIEGFVMPPSWLAPDVQPPWKGNKKSWSTLPLEEPLYVFQHGDLAPHNLIIDAKTLQVKGLIDWEYAGFYPAGMERWPGYFDRELYRNSCDALAPVLAKFLATEYLECYDSWADKDQLQKLVESGDLPDPRELRK